MLELIKILIFGGHTVISSALITVTSEPIEINFKEPLNPLNCSASLNVDITNHISKASYSEVIEEAQTVFPEGCVKISLQSKSGESAEFLRQSVAWGGRQAVSLNFKALSNLDISKEYISMSIASCKTLKSEKITWYNHGKLSCN